MVLKEHGLEWKRKFIFREFSSISQVRFAWDDYRLGERGYFGT